MATPGSLTIGGDSSRINSTQNSNNSSATRNKGENGFTILASVYNPASDSYIQNYQAIVFDAVTDTGIRRQADITSYPVESGAEVSDHVQIKNNTFKLSGIITETPIRLEKDLLYSAGVNGTRISQAIQYLDEIFDGRQPITLVTEHEVFENVILTGISYDYKSEFAMQFDLEFEQIRLVSTATVNVIATKTQSNKSVGGTVKQKVVNNAPKKTEGDTVTTEFKK
ncbi:TPA: phage baseplate protein [Raoultella planticola]|uniref:phage baseplate protein n=1 Tax=Kluyvera sichuanensis TaxID=2725494 RepID=UPI0039F5968F